MREKITRALEDYLEYILMMELGGKEARTNELAQGLGVSPPSVVEAIKRLEERGLVNHENYGAIKLTSKGRSLAEKIYRKHKILVDFLKDVLRVKPEVAEEEGCSIEHSLSEETVNKLAILKEFLKELPQPFRNELSKKLEG